MSLKFIKFPTLRVLLLLPIIFIGSSSLAQEKQQEKFTIPLDRFYIDADNVSGFRKMLSKIHFGLALGYGRTFYNQNLDGFSILQQQDSTPLLFDNSLDPSSGNIARGYRYWFNNVQTADDVSVDSSNDFLVNSDTVDLAFKAPGTSIPITATIHVDFLNRYKVGGGFMYEYHRVGDFRSADFDGRITRIPVDFGSTFYKKYFLILGAEVYRYHEYFLSIDTQIGAFNLSRKFDSGIIQKGVYFNIGATIERELSEYFTAFIRPSFDFKNYTLSITQNDDVEQGLLSYSFAAGASMLAILTHAEKSFFRIFTDSTAEELSQKSTIPVMVINLHHIT